MTTSAKVGAYLVGLAVVFVAAIGLGSVVGPVGPAGERVESPAQTDVHTETDIHGETNH